MDFRENLGRKQKKTHQQTYYLVTLKITHCQEAFSPLELVASILQLQRKDQLFDWTHFQKMTVNG